MRLRVVALGCAMLVAAGVAAAVVVPAGSGGDEAVEGAAGPGVETKVEAAPATAPAHCVRPHDPSCIRAVYKGAPDDYAQVQEIPADRLLTPGSDGRYQVERGWQITVVTAAPLPTGYTRFYLQRRNLQDPSPVSAEQLIQPVGTTYTFTVETTESRPNLITYDLTAARPRPNPRPGQKPELGDVVVTTEFLIPTLRYNLLDTTGAVTAAGSYAFLKTAGDATSAIENFGYSAWETVELRVHPADASGASRAAFYDTVAVGDTFDYRVNGVDCGARFEVTSVSATTTPRTFGIEQAAGYGGWCDFVDDPSAAKDVDFVWRVPPGIEGARGVQVLLQGEPAGAGTYHVGSGLPYIIDVPAGFQVIYGGVITLERTADMDADGEGPFSLIRLSDANTGSALGIDTATGAEVVRIVLGAADAAARVNLLFDQIMASLRRGE